jgi:hypothetical protein
MDYVLARKKPTALRSFTTSAIPSDQRQREDKSTRYKNPSYIARLETQGNSYMGEYELGNTSESLCQMLLEKEQPTPKILYFATMSSEPPATSYKARIKQEPLKAVLR